MRARRIEQRYKVSKTNIYRCGLTFVSQIINYFLIFILFQGSMTIYFIITAHPNTSDFIAPTAVLYAINTIIHIAFPFVDPGVIPSILTKYDEHQNKGIPFSKVQDDRQRDYNISIKSHFIRMRYCWKCQIYRPPRSAHCRYCNVCVQKIDHHCPWLGICIGKRNYRLFFAYLASLGGVLILVLIQAFQYILVMSFDADRAKFVFNIILICLTTVSSLFVISLLIFHIKIISQNKTTNEFCLSKWDAISGNPYQKTFFVKNIVSACCNVNQSRNNPTKEVVHRHELNADKDNTQQYISRNATIAEKENTLSKYIDAESIYDKLAEIHIQTNDQHQSQKK